MYNCNIAFLNAYQGAPGVYISFGTLNKFHLKFCEHTASHYLPTVPVFMQILSERNTPLFKTRITLTPGEKTLIAITGYGSSINAVKIPSPIMPRRPDRAYIRCINLSSLGPVSLLQKGSAVFSQVELCEKTNYILSAPGTYLFTIKAPSVTKTIEVTANAGDYKTIYFTGNRISNKAIILCERKASAPGY